MPRLLYNFSTLRKQIGGQRMKNRGKVGLREEWDWNSIFFFFEDEKQDEPSSFAFLLRFFEFYSKSRWKNSSTSFELIDVYVNYPHIVRYIGGSFPWFFAKLGYAKARIIVCARERRIEKLHGRVILSSNGQLRKNKWLSRRKREKFSSITGGWNSAIPVTDSVSQVKGKQIKSGRDILREREAGRVARISCTMACAVGVDAAREKKKGRKKRERKKKITLALELAMRLAYSCAALSRVFRCLTTTTTTTATDGAPPTYS